MRDQAWLDQLLSAILEDHFYDLPKGPPIEVKFGKRARTRLGSITSDHSRNKAVIRLTGLFREPKVPVVVVKATIVHELCHYAHGFHSGLDRKYHFPHANGVIKKEFAERGLESLYVAQKRWLKACWLEFIKSQYPNLKFKLPRRPASRRHI